MHQLELARLKNKITDVVTRVTVETLAPELVAEIIGQVLELSPAQLNEYIQYHQSLLLTTNMRELNSGYCRQKLMKQLLRDFNYEYDKIFVFLTETDHQSFLNYLDGLAPEIEPTFTGHALIGSAYEAYHVSQTTADLGLTRPQIYESIWLCTIPSGEDAVPKNQDAFSFAAMLTTLSNWQVIDDAQRVALEDQETESVDEVTSLYRFLVSELAHQAYQQKTKPIIEYYNQHGFYTRSQVLQILAERQVIAPKADGLIPAGAHLFIKDRISEPGDVVKGIPGLRPEVNLYSLNFINKASLILSKEKAAIEQLPTHEGTLTDLMADFLASKEPDEALTIRVDEYYKKIYAAAYIGADDLTLPLATFIGARKIYFEKESQYQYNPLLVAERAPVTLLLELYEARHQFEQQHEEAGWLTPKEIGHHFISTNQMVAAATSDDRRRLFFGSLNRKIAQIFAAQKYADSIHSFKSQVTDRIQFRDGEQTRHYVLPHDTLYVDVSNLQLTEKLTTWISQWVTRNSV